jgi:hypothetical protein
MENHEYIARAKSHFAGTVARDASPPSIDELPRVKVRETVMVSFESDDGKERVFVVLDRATGDFVGGGAMTRDQG